MLHWNRGTGSQVPYCVRDVEPSSAPYIQDDGNILKTHMYRLSSLYVLLIL